MEPSTRTKKTIINHCNKRVKETIALRMKADKLLLLIGIDPLDKDWKKKVDKIIFRFEIT